MIFSTSEATWKEFMGKASKEKNFAVGHWLGDWETHVAVASDDDGIWFVSICRRCCVPFFEYVLNGAGWPAEAKCKDHVF